MKNTEIIFICVVASAILQHILWILSPETRAEDAGMHFFFTFILATIFALISMAQKGENSSRLTWMFGAFIAILFGTAGYCAATFTI